jgi:hypothetical protein
MNYIYSGVSGLTRKGEGHRFIFPLDKPPKKEILRMEKPISWEIGG